MIIYSIKKEARIYSEEKIVSSISAAGKTGQQHAKNEIKILPNTIHKKINSKWINLNIRLGTVNLLEENISRTCISYACCIGREVLPLAPHWKPPYTHSSSVQFSPWVVFDSLQYHRLQHNRHLCPSPTFGTCSNSCPSYQWCHPTLSFSVMPYSSCLQSIPASGPFLTSQFFASGGQSIEASASSNEYSGLIATQSTAKRSYPVSEVGGGDRECQAATVQEQPRGATPVEAQGRRPGGVTPSPRPGVVAERSNPMSKEQWLHRRRRA